MTPITALLPVKNVEDFVESIMLALFENCQESDEILIIDDFSSDNTFKLFNEFAKFDSRIRLLRNETPGLANALNLGLNSAKNIWVARFDADDKYMPNRLALQRATLKENISCVFSDYSLNTSDGSTISILPSAVFNSCVQLSLIRNIRNPHPSVVINRDKALSVGGYIHSEFPAEDLGLWLRISREGLMIGVPVVLLNYLVRAESVSTQKREEMVIRKNELLRNSDIFKSAFLDVKNNWKLYFEHYEKLPLATLRKILLLVEYFSVARRYNISLSIQFFFMMIQTIKSRNFLSTFFGLIISQKILRDLRNIKN